MAPPHPLDCLRRDGPLVAVELRPPPAGLARAAGMDTWIDMYHALRRFARADTLVFLTDNAVGEAEEENLQHLTTNLAGEGDPAKLVPFLTSKHPLEYCLMYAARAASHGFRALTVLGGDRSVGPPRCVEFAYELRQLIRARVPQLTLGGWANPHRDAAEQVRFLLSPNYAAEFFLTQVVSHHSIRAVEAFVTEARRREVPLPGIFGVFVYRSANPATLEKLRRFFPVPAAELTREFAAGATPEEVCARTIRALRDVGVDKVYVSNLGVKNPAGRYKILKDAIGK